MKERPPSHGSPNSDMVCLDTDILVALLRGDTEALKTVEHLQDQKQPLKTTLITAYELLKGAATSSKPEENLQNIKALLSAIPVLPLTLESCEEASEVYAQLRRKGQTISEFDLLIAGIVTYNEETLLTRDQHFQLIENLQLQT